MTLSEKLVSPIAAFQYENHPSVIVEKTKLCIIHSLACAYAGTDARWSQSAKALALKLSPQGGASVWFSDQNTNMAEAAFVNAVMAQSILHEDIHRESNAHPGIIIIPTALAIAEERHLSGKMVLNAIIAGYEMMGRVGRGTACAEFGRRGFRPTSIIGTFGSCMTAGLLLELTREQQIIAFGLAASFACGINQWAVEGTDDLYFQNGIAARNGIVAAILAQQGVTAPRKVVEGSAGLCAAFGFSEEQLDAIQMLDGKYVINDILFKPAPACALVQTTAQAALTAEQSGILPEEICNGIIHTFALGKSYAGCDCCGPFTNVLQARMSNQFNFAASFIHGKISNNNYLDFSNPRVIELAGKMKVTVNSEFTKQFPVDQPVEIELHLKDGSVKRICQSAPVYLTKEDVITKFNEHCSKNLSNNQIQEIMKQIQQFEEANDCSELLKLFIKRDKP